MHRASGEDFEWPGTQSGTLIHTDAGYVSVAQNREPLTHPTPGDRARESSFHPGTWALDSVPAIIGVPAERIATLDEAGWLWLSGNGPEERVTLALRRP